MCNKYIKQIVSAVTPKVCAAEHGVGEKIMKKHSIKNLFKLITNAVAIVLISSSSVSAYTYTKEFTVIELQEKIEAMMPLTKKKFFVSITITQPKLELVNGTDEIRLKTKVEAKIPGALRGNGTSDVSGKISYNKREGAFYIHKPLILNLKINGLPEKFLPKIKNIAQSVLTQFLSTHPVYKLKDNNLKHKLAKSTLDSVIVENQKLKIHFSVF